MSNRGPTNPYVVGSTLTDEYGFYGRQDIVEDVREIFTKSRHNVVVLHGQRRIGKSSLLHRLRRDKILLEDHLPIYLDMQSYKDWDYAPARILANLARTISDKLELSLPLPTEADLAEDYNRFQHDFLRGLFRQHDQIRILLLIDEFDDVVPPSIAGPASAATLLGYFRTLVEEDREHLAFAFVVGHRLDLLSEGHRRIFKAAQTLPVGRLGQNDTYELLTSLGQKGQIDYSDEALAETWALTNGHPYLTQLLGFEIFNRLRSTSSRQATPDDVEACLESAMEHGHGALIWFWDGFKRNQQYVLSAVADLTDRQPSVSDDEINRALEQHLVFLTPLDLDNAYRDLLQGDFLVKADQQRYRFAVEFIRRWIVSHHPIKEIQRQIEESSPEASYYYQLGRHADSRHELDEAIKNYHQALEHNPYFTRVYLELAIALRAQKKYQEAIDAAEEAYKLDPESAREELLELHMEHANRLAEAKDDNDALKQARRVLEIDANHASARQLVSEKHLAQAGEHLANNQFAQALDVVRMLADPVPIVEEARVGQRVRKLWLDYCRKITQLENPEWDEAQIALDSLQPLGLINEEIRAEYNQITLGKAQFYLNRDELERALATLENELKQPIPIQEIKERLLACAHRQESKGRWAQAERTTVGLCQLIDDQETRAARLEFYRHWGDALLEAQDFEGAIDVYGRGEPKEFEARIADAYLRQAAWHQERHQLAEAEWSYQQALAIQDKKTVRAKAYQQLESYFQSCRQQKRWENASGALEAMKALKLAKSDLPALEANLHMDQAKAELAQGHLDDAFQHLAELPQQAETEVKALIRDHAQQKALGREWETGADALSRLSRLLPEDREVTTWLANWLLLWARVLFSEDRLGRQPAQAKHLCQEVLELAAEEDMPYLDLRNDVELPPDEAVAGLRQHTCALLADILLEQAQTSLDQNNLSEAHTFCAEALNLVWPPDGLKRNIRESLYTYIQQQILMERWENAENTLEMAIDLNVSDPAMDGLLKEMPANRASLELKADRPAAAFEILNQRETDFSHEEHQTIEAMVYLFSRLYAGRDRWDLARQALKGLHQWRRATDEVPAKVILGWLDDLNREQLGFVKGRREPMPVPPVEIERLEYEVQVAGGGYRDARALGLDSLDTWIQDFIKTGLELGRAYLANKKLEKAILVFQKIRDVESGHMDHVSQISQSLHNYSELRLNQGEWEKARRAAEELRGLDLLAPNGRAQPDPRADGAIQRVLLAQAQAWLGEDRVKQTFDEILSSLPRPHPTTAVKEIVRNYSQERQAQGTWPNAIQSLRRLDEFLTEDRQDGPKVRDMEALAWLVDGLEQWGQRLEEEDLEMAAGVYGEALMYTRAEADPRSHEMADHSIRVSLELAQRCLDNDPLTPDVAPDVHTAIAYYQNILNIPEHERRHEAEINQALYKHSRKLTGKEKWARAHQVLDALENLYYPNPYDDDRLQFATWRRELALNEVHRRLEKRELTPAFDRQRELKSWLDEYNVPGVTWRESQGQVKTLVYEKHCLGWLGSQDWDPATRALAHLAELIPGDDDITGWQVDAFCQWGDWSHRHGHLEAAQARYKQALEKAAGQKEAPVGEIEGDLLVTQLAYAQHYLGRSELDKAVAIYKEILQKPKEYLDRADEIRQALKAHSDRLAHKTDWGSAHRALNRLRELELDNDEVFGWRQELTLEEMKARLRHDDFDAAFESLEAMEQPWPLGDVKAVVHQYIWGRVEDADWSIVSLTMRRLTAAVGGDRAAGKWARQELLTLGKRLLESGDAKSLRIAQEAFQLAQTFQKNKESD